MSSSRPALVETELKVLDSQAASAIATIKEVQLRLQSYNKDLGEQQ